MELSKYHPINTNDKVDAILSGIKLIHDFIDFESSVLFEIKKVKVQLYFKEQLASMLALGKIYVVAKKILRPKKQEKAVRNRNAPGLVKKSKLAEMPKLVNKPSRQLPTLECESNNKIFYYKKSDKIARVTNAPELVKKPKLVKMPNHQLPTLKYQAANKPKETIKNNRALSNDSAIIFFEKYKNQLANKSLARIASFFKINPQLILSWVHKYGGKATPDTKLCESIQKLIKPELLDLIAKFLETRALNIYKTLNQTSLTETSLKTSRAFDDPSKRNFHKLYRG